MKRIYLFLLFFVVAFAAFANNAANYAANSAVNVLSDSILYESRCDKEMPFVWRGHSYSQSGTYRDTSVTGEDTVIYILQLTVLQSSRNSFSAITCQGTPYILNGKAFLTPGIHYDTLPNYLGCDSIIELNLTVIDTITIYLVYPYKTWCRNEQPQLHVDLHSDPRDTVNYQWYLSYDASTWTPISGATADSYYPSQDTLLRYFKVSATSVKGCGSKESDIIFVSVYPQFQAGSISLNGNPAIVCRNTQTANQLIGSAASGGSGDYSYKWQKSDSTGTVWIPISSATSINLPAGQTISHKTSFRRIDKDNTCNVYDTTNVITIDVYQSPTKPVLAPYADTICYNSIPQQLSIATQSTGYSSVDSVIYQWEYSNDNVNFYSLNATGITYTPQSRLTAPKWYRVKAVLVSGCHSVYSDAIKVNVYDPLDVQVVLGSTTVCYMTPAQLSVSASGVDNRYSYRWYESSDAASIGTQVGTNSSSLNTTPNIGGTLYYKCVVTSIRGCGSDTSDVITIVTRTQFQAGEIDINGNPAIVCRNNQTANPLTGSAASGGSGNYSYRWQKSDSTGTYWTAISGKTSINLPAGQTISHKTSFRRIDKDNTCNVYDTTNVITIDVYQSPTKPVLAPYTDTICYNSIPQQLSIATQSTGYSSVDSVIYQWEYSNDNVNFYSLNATGITYTSQSRLTAPKWYRVKAVLVSGCHSVYSDAIKVNVYDPLDVQVVSGSKTVCYMTSAQLSVSASGVDNRYSYRWYESSVISSIGTQVGTNSSSLNTTAKTDGIRYYRCVVTSIRGCGSDTSNVITVTTRPQLRPGEISLQVDSIVCSDSVVVNPFSATPATGGSNNISYQWQYRKNEGWISIPGENQSTLSQFAIEDTTYFRRMAIDGICGDTSTNVIMIDVFRGLSKPELSSYSSTVCYGSVPAGQLSITIPSLPDNPKDSVAYSWEYTTDLNAGFSPLNETGTVYHFNQNLTDTTYYRVVAKLVSGCDREISKTVRVCVYSQLNVSGISGTNAVCHNTPATLSVTASGVDGVYDYQWYKSSTPSVESSWTQVGINSPTYTTVAQTASGTLYYKCSVTSRTGCGVVWTPSPFAVETKPVLSAGSITGNDTICFNTANYQITSSQPASGSFESQNYYRWEKADLSVDNWTTISNETSANLVNPITLSQSTRFRRIAYNSTCDSAGKPSNIVTIYVRDQVIAPIITSVPDSICYGGSHTLQMSVRPPDGTLGEHFTFKWYVSSTAQMPSSPADTGENYTLQNLTQDCYCWVKAFSSCGCANVTSSYVHIHIMQPLKVVILGPDSTLCYNTGDTIHAVASGSKNGCCHYLWQQTTDATNRNSWVTVPGSQDVLELATPARTVSIPYYYRCVVTNSYCSLESDTSNIMQINTFKEIIPGSLKPLDSVGYCQGEEVEKLTFKTFPEGDYETIEWLRRDKNSSAWITVKPESPATDSAMVYSPGSSLTDTVYFCALLSNKCRDDKYTPEIKVCINPLPNQKTIHSKNDRVCSNEVVTYYIAESDFSPRYDYRWYVDESYGTIQGKDNGREIEIIWNAEQENANVTLTITDTAPSRCYTNCILPGIKVEEGVDTVSIYRKRGSNILYVSDSLYNSYYYQWLRYPNGKTISESENLDYAQGKRYIELDIDNVENDLKNYTYGLKLTRKPKEITDQCSSFSRYWGNIEPTVSKASASRIYASTHIRDVIHLRIENPDKLPTDFSIYSVSGTLIYANTLGNAEYIDEEIPVTLVSGVYLLHVRIGDEVSTIKLMAE